MKRLVKILAIALSVLTIGSLAACGGSEFNPDKNISVVTREDGSGTKSAFMEIIGLKGKKDIGGVVVATSTAAVLTEVKSNPLAIAFDSLGYVTDEVKKLTVDGVAATPENIKNGTYAVSRPLSVVYKPENLTGVNRAFMNYLCSSDAQTIIESNGYVTSTDGASVYSKTGLTGSINLTGSTSLRPLMEKLATAFETIETGISVTVGGGGSGTGYNDAQNGVSAFGMISEKFNQAKAEGCVSKTVALDGIAIIVNLKNTVDNITKEQLKNIYDVDAGENAIKTWKQVIGE